MNIQNTTMLSKTSLAIAFGLGTVLLSTNTLTAQETQSIRIDGSSTVYPITNKIVEEYRAAGCLTEVPQSIEISCYERKGGVFMGS